MGVHVDQPRHRHQAVARHDAVGGPRITGACVDDGVAAHHQVGVFDVDVRTQVGVPCHQRGQVLEMGDAGLIGVAHGRLSVRREKGVAVARQGPHHLVVAYLKAISRPL
ncbi:hypothetical protein G6F65_022635 [Rhizopus arrhizus]|nr:hypothetical protein G6F65_022635 [Rhizopus arrhizus]